MERTICIGYDTPHPQAFAVCRHSLRRHMTREMRILGISLADMQARGLYTRQVERRTYHDGSSHLWDTISEAPMSTEFAISRFLSPFLAGWAEGWVLFMDCDMLALTDINRLWDYLDPRYALMCVQPNYTDPRVTKMDGRAQTHYPRKLWSSLMAINMSHAANSALTLQLINSVPGRDLHRFCWLPDALIGELPAQWNWMEGITDPQTSPAIVHYTHGGPWLRDYQGVQFADEWCAEHELWIRGDTPPYAMELSS
jgi:hypothetical protein